MSRVWSDILKMVSIVVSGELFIIVDCMSGFRKNLSASDVAEHVGSASVPTIFLNFSTICIRRAQRTALLALTQEIIG